MNSSFNNSKCSSDYQAGCIPTRARLGPLCSVRALRAQPRGVRQGWHAETRNVHTGGRRRSVRTAQATAWSRAVLCKGRKAPARPRAGARTDSAHLDSSEQNLRAIGYVLSCARSKKCPHVCQKTLKIRLNRLKYSDFHAKPFLKYG